MNIEMLQDYISAFRREIVDSGFKRDLDDYSSSLAASQNNIVALREIAGKVLTSLDLIYSGDLPESLARLLPNDQLPPFTAVPHNDGLRALIEDTEIALQEFFTQLNQFLNQLKKQIQQNIAEIAKVEEFIRPYISEDTGRIAEDGLAMLAIVFNEQRTITSLEHFSKTLSAWNRVLPIYHQLVKSDSPRDIRIVEIQNGSIDCVVNLDLNVALDLVELFKLGFQVFAAYLSYKHVTRPIIDSYHGNKKLINQEKEREGLLLENIGTVVQRLISKQHKEAKKLDKGVDETAVPKKIEQVSNLITSHITKGNDIKLLALPKTETAERKEDEVDDHAEALRKQSVAARRQLRCIPPDAQQKLLAAYGALIEETDS